MKNVLVIFPDNLHKPTGGLGVQFKNIYEGLKDKINFSIVGYPDPEMEKQDNYIGVYHPVPEVKHGSINTLIGHTEYFAQALKFPKPDIIHAYDWTCYYSGVKLAEHWNVPLLITIQLSANALASSQIYNCGDFRTLDGQWLHKAHVELEWLGLKQANKIITVSNGYSKYFNNFKEKISIIPNGIDVSKWKPQTSITFPGNPNNKKLVYIGRFAQMKAVDILLQSNIPSNVDLILIGSPNGGDTETWNLLQKVVNTKSNVFYLGPLYNQDKIDALFSADGVIIPSRHEPFGIVGLEALVSENIVISSRVDGLGDYLNDTNSLKCEISFQGIEQAILEFVNLSKSRKNKLISNGKNTCLKYLWKDIIDQYYKEYTEI